MLSVGGSGHGSEADEKHDELWKENMRFKTS